MIKPATLTPVTYLVEGRFGDVGVRLLDGENLPAEHGPAVDVGCRVVRLLFHELGRHVAHRSHSSGHLQRVQCNVGAAGAVRGVLNNASGSPIRQENTRQRWLGGKKHDRRRRSENRVNIRVGEAYTCIPGERQTAERAACIDPATQPQNSVPVTC